MEFSNAGEWVPMYLAEGPSRRLVGQAKINQDGTMEGIFDKDSSLGDILQKTNPKMSFRVVPSAVEFDFVPVEPALPPKYKQPFHPLQLDTSIPPVPKDDTEWQKLIQKVVIRNEDLLAHAVVYGAQIRHLEELREEKNAGIMRREWLRFWDSHEEDDYLYAKLQEAYWLGYNHTELYERIMTGKPLD